MRKPLERSSATVRRQTLSIGLRSCPPGAKHGASGRQFLRRICARPPQRVDFTLRAKLDRRIWHAQMIVALYPGVRRSLGNARTAFHGWVGSISGAQNSHHRAVDTHA
jgi:hypothetical protein